MYHEEHQQGHFSFENVDVIKEMDLQDCDVGLAIHRDGRIWVCVNGIALIRFKPKEPNFNFMEARKLD